MSTLTDIGHTDANVLLMADDGSRATYDQAKAHQDSLYSLLNAKDSALQAFPKGEMGLTPDSVKASREFKLAKVEYEAVFQAVRKFNAHFTRQYRKDIQAERMAKYAKVA